MRALLLAVTALLASSVAHADEGMWLLNQFPKDKVKQSLGVSVSDAWLDNVRLSSARLAGGCSGSFVSDSGLVMTNHHCARECIHDLSTAAKDFEKDGFYAKATTDEHKCPGMEVNRLLSMRDVTARLNKATAGLSPDKFNAAQRAEMAAIEKECQTSAKLRCDVVTLFQGGSYQLYTYERHQDVRLVFAPEESIASFGGDPDNFNFPRYDLDATFVRVYQDGKPLHNEHYFKWSKTGAAAGDATFVTGHPGRTERLSTLAELTYERDVRTPDALMRMAEMRGVLTEFQNRGAEQKRVSAETLADLENGYKVYRGRFATLLDPTFVARRQAEEKALRDAVAKDPQLNATYGAAWSGIETALQALKPMRQAFGYVEAGSAFRGELFSHARRLVRAAEERSKPNGERLREFRESAMPAVAQQLLDDAPISAELDTTLMTFSLTKMREDLGTDHPLVKKILGQASPSELATRLVKGSTLANAAVRKQLWEGGKAAVDASTDPLILMAKAIDGDARALRKRYEEQVQGALKKNAELVAKARFAVYGQTGYPDATFTLRVSYGRVAGWTEGDHEVAPFTTFAGAFAHATGREPFALPPAWLAAQKQLIGNTPLNFSTTNDIIGGNSGSPVINSAGEIVGLVFDGNIHSIGGDFWFDPKLNRAVAVHSEGLMHALQGVYHADRLVSELRPSTAVGRATR